MGMSEQERRVCGEIAGRHAALLDDLRRLVEIPTGGNYAPGLDRTRDLLCDRLRRLGAAVELVPGDGAARPEWLHGVEPDGPVPPTAVCRREKGAAGRPVLIAGHLDTVHDPNGPFRELTLAPDGQRATGPGCVDMKGGLVIAVHALEALEACGEGGAWTVLLNSDEETGSYFSAGAIRAEAARVAAAGGVGLALEPAMPDGGLVVERSGTGHFMIEVRGRSAHVGRDFASGVSAVYLLARCMLEVEKMSDPARGLIVNIGPIEGGTVTNAVPDRARAWGNVRFADEAGAEELRRKLEGLATAQGLDGSRASGHRSETSGTVGTVLVRTSFVRQAKPRTEGTMRLAEMYRRVVGDVVPGQALPFGRTGGVCDGNTMQAAGLACIDTVGVRGGGLHTPEEWIEIPSLVERCQMLAVMLMRMWDGR
jgi:glutamate carboxypeptidase